MFLQAQKGNIYFIELAERVEAGNYDTWTRGVRERGTANKIINIVIVQTSL